MYHPFFTFTTGTTPPPPPPQAAGGWDIYDEQADARERLRREDNELVTIIGMALPIIQPQAPRRRRRLT